MTKLDSLVLKIRNTPRYRRRVAGQKLLSGEPPPPKKAVNECLIFWNPKSSAFTIGTDNSEDLEISQQFCREKGIPQIVIPLGKNYLKLSHVKAAIAISELTEYGDIINAVITTELYRRIHAANIKVVLGGDGSDELFGGYDMYALKISETELQQLFLHKLMNLHRTELQRVDRCSMAFNVETRVPFLDGEVVQLALSIEHDWKVKDKVEKWCLREAFKQELPNYIIKRKKNPLSHGEWFARMGEIV